MTGTISIVALFTRAWIEIQTSFQDTAVHRVALFTRAWIEMDLGGEKSRFRQSPSSRGRGLKCPDKDNVEDDFGRPLHEGVD